MLALLPFLSGALLTLIFYSKQKDWRSSLVAAAIVLGTFIALATESLSLFHLVNFAALASLWLLLASVLIFVTIKKKVFDQLPSLPKSIVWSSLDDFDQVLCMGTGIIILLVGVVAIVAPPNNWDSMSYVMPRVIHWMQNQSVAHYPTHFAPQLNNDPSAEFLLLHLQILSGGDWLANVPQWLSMIGCLIGVSLIAQHLGADLKGQIFSGVICATIPVGILQASNSKNTYVIAFWLVCSAYYGILLIKNQPSWSLILAVSTSLSLAILTKGTAYVYALPFVIWIGASILLKLKQKSFNYLVGAIVIFLILNIGHYWRNFVVFGSPISTYPFKLGNEIYSFPVLISSVLRNISLHLVPPFLSGERMDHLIIRIHQFLGVNPVDPRLNFPGASLPSEFTTQTVQLFEDTAGNAFHFWLTLLAIALLFISRPLRNNKILVIYCLATLGSFLTFCLLIKWQIWHSRLHLPIFVWMSPVIGLVLAQAFTRRIAQWILVLLLIAASPYLLLNETRPIAAPANIFNTDRITQYFAARSNLQADYVKAANLVKQSGCSEVGLILRPDAWEYPLWVLLTQGSQQPLRAEHVNVTGPSKTIAEHPDYRNFQPCRLVSIGTPRTQQTTVHDQPYVAAAWHNADALEPIQVFAPANRSQE